MNVQVIPTSAHAVGDYLTSATAPLAARRLGVTPTTRRIVDGMATMAGIQSLMTDYEGGAVRMMPMRAHLASDIAMGVTLLTTAAMMRAPARDRQLLAGLGAFSVVYALMTRPSSSSSPEIGSWRNDWRNVDVTSTETATSVPHASGAADTSRFTMTGAHDSSPDDVVAQPAGNVHGG